MKLRMFIGIVMCLVVVFGLHGVPAQAVTTFSIESIATYDHYPVDGYYGEGQVTLSIAVLVLQLLGWVLWLIAMRRAVGTIDLQQRPLWMTKFYIGLGMVVVNALILFAYHPVWLHLALGTPVWALGVACSPSRLVFAGIMSVIQGTLSVVAVVLAIVANVRHPIQLPRVRRLFWFLVVVQILMVLSLLIQPMLPAC